MKPFPHAAEYRHFLAELRAARNAASMSQEALASGIGVHQTLISKGELGTRRIDVVELRVWLQVLGVSLVDFAGRLEARLGRHSRVPPIKKARKSPGR